MTNPTLPKVKVLLTHRLHYLRAEVKGVDDTLCVQGFKTAYHPDHVLSEFAQQFLQ